MPAMWIGTAAPWGKLKLTTWPTWRLDDVASLESTMAVLVEAIADALPPSMVSASTLLRLDGSMAAMSCELPLINTDVLRTSVTSASLLSCVSDAAAWLLKDGPWSNTMKSARKAPAMALL